MSDRVRTGRTIVLVYIALLLLSNAGLVLWDVISRGTDRLAGQTLAFAVAVVLCRFLYRGNKVAKGILVAVCCLAGGLAIPLILQGETDILFAGVHAVLFLSFAWMLLFSRSVNEFLGYQRQGVA